MLERVHEPFRHSGEGQPVRPGAISAAGAASVRRWRTRRSRPQYRLPHPHERATLVKRSARRNRSTSASRTYVRILVSYSRRGHQPCRQPARSCGYDSTYPRVRCASDRRSYFRRLLETRPATTSNCFKVLRFSATAVYTRAAAGSRATVTVLVNLIFLIPQRSAVGRGVIDVGDRADTVA